MLFQFANTPPPSAAAHFLRGPSEKTELDRANHPSEGQWTNLSRSDVFKLKSINCFIPTRKFQNHYDLSWFWLINWLLLDVFITFAIILCFENRYHHNDRFTTTSTASITRNASRRRRASQLQRKHATRPKRSDEPPERPKWRLCLRARAGPAVHFHESFTSTFLLFKNDNNDLSFFSIFIVD